MLYNKTTFNFTKLTAKTIPIGNVLIVVTGTLSVALPALK